METALDTVANLIRGSESVVFLTGAGYSTASGIPDFRSRSSGLWEQQNPFDVASLSAFKRDPTRFYQWFHPLAKKISAAAPNPAHRALARLEMTGRVKAVITQNIDGLHQASGSKTVHEVHGSLRHMVCLGCYTRYLADEFLEAYLESVAVPECPGCGAIIKPDTILFEEQLPAETWIRARQAARDASVIVAAGTSLAVMPVAGLPAESIKNGAQFIVINNTPTECSFPVNHFLEGDLVEIMPDLAARVIDV
jgi:NAD-dependent deacetylase